LQYRSTSSLQVKYENGITPLGLYITQFVRFGGQDNLLAVKVDNSLITRKKILAHPSCGTQKILTRILED